jgi:hypothetical protein
MTIATQETVEGEVIDASTALDVRHPAAPATLEQIAALGDGANEIVRARIQVLQTLRKASIQATSPEDWLLFHAVDRRTGQERTVGYLQDAGCDRVASLWGIEVFGIEKPERIMANDGTANFMYLILGSGRCSITGQTVEQMEGGRSSSDDFCKDERGTSLELKVRKAARANLDGNIVRELTGLKSVPLNELQAAWEGSHKDWNRCVKGRGYGSGQGAGTVSASTPDLSAPVPKCPQCGGDMWDNRTKKQSAKSPDFKCKTCGKAIWADSKADSKTEPKTEAKTGKPAGGSNGSTFDEAAEQRRLRAVLRGKFTELQWTEKRQDQFLGGRDINAFSMTELDELISTINTEVERD